MVPGLLSPLLRSSLTSQARFSALPRRAPSLLHGRPHSLDALVGELPAPTGETGRKPAGAPPCGDRGGQRRRVRPASKREPGSRRKVSARDRTDPGQK